MSMDSSTEMGIKPYAGPHNNECGLRDLFQLPRELFRRICHELNLTYFSDVRMRDDGMRDNITITNMSEGCSFTITKREIFDGRYGPVGKQNVQHNEYWLEQSTRSRQDFAKNKPVKVTFDYKDYLESDFTASFEANFSRLIKAGKINYPLPKVTPTPVVIAEDAQENMILVIANTLTDAEVLAEHIMGWKKGDWVFVNNFAKMLQYRNSSVYICGNARDRPDFGAIEGLFIIGNHTVMDMNE